MTRTRLQPVAVTPRHRNITSSGFDTLLQEQEADDQVHAGEVLSYLAIESGHGDGWDVSTFGGVTNQQKSVPLIGGFTDIPVFLGSIQTFNGFDTSALRYGRVNNGTVSMWLNIEEEKSKDTETKHGAETVGYLAHRHGDLTGESWDAASSGWITPIGNFDSHVGGRSPGTPSPTQRLCHVLTSLRNDLTGLPYWTRRRGPAETVDFS